MAKKIKNKKSAKPVKQKQTKKTNKPAKKVAKVVKKVSKPVKKKVVTKKAAKAKPVKKAAKVVKKVAKSTPKKAAKTKPAKVIAKKKEVVKVAKKETKVIAKPAPAKTVERKPMLRKPAPEAKKRGEEKQFTSIPGIVKKDEFVIDKRPLSELNINMKKPLVKKMDFPKPKPQMSTDKRTKYSDKELQEFKQIILHKLDEARKDYDLLKSTLSHKDDHGTDDTSPTFKLLEDGSDVMSKEETAQLAGRQEKFIQSLQNALIRIENKTYGICRVTGKLISKERLRSVPHATLAIEAKLEQSSVR